MPKHERLLLAATAAATLILRALAFFRYRFDSDEQQHLHVVWAWTAGLLPYRDVFDNHAPLFHLLMAPILAAFGERADILLWMRIPMLVFFGAVLWSAYVIGRRLYDERVALWSVILLALFPPFFLKSLEFRNDNLWSAAWMLALVVLTRAPLTPRRLFIAGLLLGIAFATSLKTAVLLIALAGGALLAWMFLLRRSGSLPPLQWLVAGGAIAPGALVSWFAAKGALGELVYGAFTFNSRLSAILDHLWIGRAVFPFATAAVVYLAWRFRGHAPAWRYFFAVFLGLHVVVLTGWWPLISPRDFLAVMPLYAIFAAAAMTRARNAIATLATAIAVMSGALWYYADGFENHTDWHVTMMNQALRLTHPGELLMDVKGETIYRRRPHFHAFENVTRAQIAKGMLDDTVPEDVVANRTYVAQADGPMWPPRARAFLSENFLNMGRLRATGQWIREDGTFTIAIPGEYVIVGPAGELRGRLDGQPYDRARVLQPGPHRWEGAAGAAVMWAPAFRRGHSPFHLRDLDF